MELLKLILDSDAKLSKVGRIDESAGSKYKIKGIFASIGLQNRNKRTYTREAWEEAIAEYIPHLSDGSIASLMEYHHPARATIEPIEAVGKITSLYIEGDYVMGEAVLLDNPKANQLKTLIDNGIKISVSSRALGLVKNGFVNKFKLITFDVVPDPSDYNATMNGICENYQLNEGVVIDRDFYITENGEIMEKTIDNDQLLENVVVENEENTESVPETTPEVQEDAPVVNEQEAAVEPVSEPEHVSEPEEAEAVNEDIKVVATNGPGTASPSTTVSTPRSASSSAKAKIPDVGKKVPKTYDKNKPKDNVATSTSVPKPAAPAKPTAASVNEDTGTCDIAKVDKRIKLKESELEIVKESITEFIKNYSCEYK